MKIGTIYSGGGAHLNALALCSSVRTCGNSISGSGLVDSISCSLNISIDGDVDGIPEEELSSYLSLRYRVKMCADGQRISIALLAPQKIFFISTESLMIKFGSSKILKDSHEIFKSVFGYDLHTAKTLLDPDGFHADAFGGGNVVVQPIADHHGFAWCAVRFLQGRLEYFEIGLGGLTIKRGNDGRKIMRNSLFFQPCDKAVGLIGDDAEAVFFA